MADISGTGSVDTGYQSQSDLLVQAYIQSEQSRIDVLTSRKDEMQSKQNYLNSLNSRLNSLVGNIDTFTADNAADEFITRKVTSSDTGVVTVTANEDALVGVSQVRVNQLATSDILISDKLTLEDEFGVESGTYRFRIQTGEGDPYIVDVDFNGTETNESAMSKIVHAINLQDDIEVSAALVKDTDTTGRLTITSSETGSDYQVVFTDMGKVTDGSEIMDFDTDGDEEITADDEIDFKWKNGILKQIGFTKQLANKSTDRTEAGDTTAGFIQSDASKLDAIIEVNGIRNITRGTNSIDDVLPGLTINLLQPQDDDALAVVLNTSVDRTAVESLINPLLDAYNDTIKFLKSDVSVSRGDSSISGLYNTLRDVFTRPVESDDPDMPRYLSDIGIRTNSDGTLYIYDFDLLDDLLEDDPMKVAHIFTAVDPDKAEGNSSTKDGLAVKLENMISGFVGSGGILQTKNRLLSDQIDQNEDRTAEVQDQIERQAEALRDEYESMLEVFLNAQNQYSTLGALSSGVDTSAYQSLAMSQTSSY